MRAFIIAMPCEADAVRPALKAGDRLYLSGIGKVNAAMATQLAIDEGATEIVNAGLAGGIDPTLQVGQVVEISAAVEYDFDLDDLNHRGVGVLDERTDPFFVINSSATGRKLATGDHFRNDEADFALIRSLGCSVRDMEGAAIAQVCERRGIPMRCIKAISNVAGRGGMVDQYETSRELALRSLTAALVDLKTAVI